MQMALTRAVVLATTWTALLHLVGVVNCQAPAAAGSAGVSVQWDVVKSGQKEYTVIVRLANNQMMTPIPRPGWAVSFDWKMNEVLFSVDNGQALTLVDCSSSPAAPAFPDEIKYALSCAPRPIIVDNGPRQGFLSAPGVDPWNNTAQFTMKLGKGPKYFGAGNLTLPGNFSVGIEGYSCQMPVKIAAGRQVPVATGSRQYYSSLASYNIECGPSVETLSLPRCAVSLSAFFNTTLASVQPCICGCNSTSIAGPTTSGVSLKSTVTSTCTTVGLNAASRLVKTAAKQTASGCDDGCGTDIHIDISQEFGDGWKVTVAVANKGATDVQPWLLAMDMPLLGYLQTTYSVAYQYLQGTTAAWYGKPFFNDALLASPGNQVWVMIFNKTAPATSAALASSPLKGPVDQRAFPTAVTFMGQACAMPSADLVPRNPASGQTSGGDMRAVPLSFSVALLLVLMVSVL